jgi:glucokinase
MPQFLGIEIGGTKLQLAVGRGDGQPFEALERREIDRSRGAAGILAQIEEAGRKLLAAHDVERIGIGFGGPVRSAEGRVTTSHQVSGWDDFPLAEWCGETLGRPAVLANDCDAAALAEARFGAGRGARIVFFVTVGTGIGGGLVVDGKLFGSERPAVAEIGHLRPGLDATGREQTIESLAAGPAIEAAARRQIAQQSTGNADVADLQHRAAGSPDRLTAHIVADAAAAGNPLARDVMNNATRALGWAIAQVVTLVAAEVVVVGGGVSLSPESVFLAPLREAVSRYTFPPLRDSFSLAPAALGEQVVVHGALALAAGAL